MIPLAGRVYLRLASWSSLTRRTFPFLLTQWNSSLHPPAAYWHCRCVCGSQSACYPHPVPHTDNLNSFLFLPPLAPCGWKSASFSSILVEPANIYIKKYARLGKKLQKMEGQSTHRACKRAGNRVLRLLVHIQFRHWDSLDRVFWTQQNIKNNNA